MKKYQLTPLIETWLGGGSAPADVSGKYRPGIIDFYVEMAFNDLMVRVFQNSDAPNKSDLDAYTKVFLINTFIPPDLSDTGKAEFEMPTKSGVLLQIPNNKAIRKVYVRKSPIDYTKCLYRDMGMDEVYSQLEVETYLTNPRYGIIGNKICFNADSRFFLDPVGGQTSLRVFMIVPFSEWEDDDELPAPLENNFAIHDMVVEKLRQVPPEDKIIDDNYQAE